jgi:hypothetical protein
MSGWLFLLFCSELSAMDIADPAEILSADGSGNEKTAKTLTVLPLFSAALAKSNKGSRSRPYRRRPIRRPA